MYLPKLFSFPFLNWLPHINNWWFHFKCHQMMCNETPITAQSTLFWLQLAHFPAAPQPKTLTRFTHIWSSLSRRDAQEERMSSRKEGFRKKRRESVDGLKRNKVKLRLECLIICVISSLFSGPLLERNKMAKIFHLIDRGKWKTARTFG